MPRSFRVLFLTFIVFAVNDLTYCQVPKDLFCGQVCLSVQVTCTCSLVGPNLIWRVRNVTSGLVGQGILLSTDLNNPTPLPTANAFEATLTNIVNGTLTATLTFITLSKYDDFRIECDVDGFPENFTIDVPGPPSFVTDLRLAGFTTASVMLTFTPPTNSPCIANYTIATAADAPLSTTDTSVMIKPGNDPDVNTYSVSVVAVDFAGRMGTLSSEDCFMFSGPNAVSFAGVSFGTDDAGACAALVDWTSSECLPEITGYNITASSTNGVENETVSASSYTLNDVFVGETYSLIVVPSNVLGLGSPTSTVFAVPTTCPTTPIARPTTTTDGRPITSATDPPITGVATAIIIGAVCGVVGFLLVIVLVVVIILVVIFKQKTKNGTSPAPQDKGFALNDYETAPSEMSKPRGNDKAPKKPERTGRGSKQAKADEADAHRSLPQNQNPSQGVYADLSHDTKKTSKPGSKSSEQVTYSGIAHPRQMEYAALEMGRGGEIPQKPEGVVYSEVNN